MESTVRPYRTINVSFVYIVLVTLYRLRALVWGQQAMFKLVSLNKQNCIALLGLVRTQYKRSRNNACLRFWIALDFFFFLRDYFRHICWYNVLVNGLELIFVTRCKPLDETNMAVFWWWWPHSNVHLCFSFIQSLIYMQLKETISFYSESVIQSKKCGAINLGSLIDQFSKLQSSLGSANYTSKTINSCIWNGLFLSEAFSSLIMFSLGWLLLSVASFDCP